MAGLLLLHTPPAAASVKAIVLPAQTIDAPLITPASGGVLTVISLVATAVPHELVTEYDMTALPVMIPETMPPETEAAVPELVHAPPDTGSARVIVDPTQTPEAPAIVPAVADGVTTIDCDAVAVAHELVTV